MKTISYFCHFHSRFLSRLVGILVLFTGALYAQSTLVQLPTSDNSSNFIIQDNLSAGLMRLNGDGGFYLLGNTSSGTIPITGSGTRLMWYPYKSAFRAGYASGSQWDDANIGNYSTAFGWGTTASGIISTAMGAGTTASGENSIAIGTGASASGQGAVALGTSTIANVNYATAIGHSTTASGGYSTAMGHMTTASGGISTAMGFNTGANGMYSTALGSYTSANSYSSLAVGQYNVGNGTAASWISTDPIFEIGIGIDAFNKDNAVTVLKNGNVGIGTVSPEFKLALDNDGGIIAKGTISSGATLPTLGGGPRFIWYPRKAAFRAGNADGSQWDDASIGNYSAAMGNNTIASGNYSIAAGFISAAYGMTSVAMGLNAAATGDYTIALGQSATASNYNSTAIGYFAKASSKASTAIGDSAVASGYASLAMGFRDTASAPFSTAIGYDATASGDASTAMGAYTRASGWASTAMGYMTTSSAIYSTAMGDNTTASGVRSTAMGSYVSTNSKGGAFIIGDNSTNVVSNSSANNEMIMRFAGGYRLYTNSALTAGVTLAGDGNSWSSVSDARRKEQFVKADGEFFLNNLAQLNLGSWNYIGQDAKDFRHYGPMAQEIFKYFGNDGIGTIGNDTMLASADMDGIMMICLQALEKRTSELREANEDIASMKARIEKLEQIIATTTIINSEQITLDK